MDDAHIRSRYSNVSQRAHNGTATQTTHTHARYRIKKEARYFDNDTFTNRRDISLLDVSAVSVALKSSSNLI